MKFLLTLLLGGIIGWMIRHWRWRHELSHYRREQLRDSVGGRTSLDRSAGAIDDSYAVTASTDGLFSSLSPEQQASFAADDLDSQVGFGTAAHLGSPLDTTSRAQPAAADAGTEFELAASGTTTSDTSTPAASTSASSAQYVQTIERLQSELDEKVAQHDKLQGQTFDLHELERALAAKNDEVTVLATELAASQTRVSTLESKLIEAEDAMDASRNLSEYIPAGARNSG